MKIYVRYFIIGFLSLVSSCVNEKEDAGMQPDAVEVGDMLPEFTVVMNDGRKDGKECEIRPIGRNGHIKSR